MDIADRAFSSRRGPEITLVGGQRPVTRILDQDEYRPALLAKLNEEAAEARKATAEDLVGELADVLEVLSALLADLDMSMQELSDLR